jgi:hypothetical protein
MGFSLGTMPARTSEPAKELIPRQMFCNRARLKQAAEKLGSEGGGGFIPHTKRAQSMGFSLGTMPAKTSEPAKELIPRHMFYNMARRLKPCRFKTRMQRQAESSDVPNLAPLLHMGNTSILYAGRQFVLILSAWPALL